MTAETLYLLGAHAFGDWIFQTDWMAENKLDTWTVRAVHVSVYTACFAPVLVVLGRISATSLLFLAAIAASHYLIDSRRWADVKDGFEAYPIALDQALHVATIAYFHAVLFAL